MSKSAVVIGSGFAGLSAAISLADRGWNVRVVEKNDQPGGRARVWKHEGFTFDMGPSWYWMPDVFESFFNKFGKKVSDYYQLERLDPSYKVFFKNDHNMDIPAGKEALIKLFEHVEKGAGEKLKDFLKAAGDKYRIGMSDLVYKPGLSPFEFANAKVLKNLFKLNIFQSFHGYIRKYFRNPFLLQLLEFPVLFLGAAPKDTPALYSLMNYADVELGTWYPMGGMHKIIEGMTSLAREKGVEFSFNSEIKHIVVKNGRAVSAESLDESFKADYFVGGADYNHIEQHLLESAYRNYEPKYWDDRMMSPSSLIFYIGLDKKLDGLLHHNLFFDEDFDRHADELYSHPSWPSQPLFYVCCPSKTDPSVAPDGKENMFVLIPVASGLNDNKAVRDKYFHIVMERMEKRLGTRIAKHVIFKRSYAHKDFIDDYHAFKGNAYGLANTLGQTAILKPRIKNKKVQNLFYAGQLTVPGPGVPPALISGQIAAELINNDQNK